jgi:hypothetical protein
MPIDATTPLYKQTPTGGYVKYDPLTGRYSLVAASRVPPLMRLSIPVAPAKRPGLSRRLLRKILMMAMLEVQQKANDAGDPQSAVPLLAKLSAMLRDPDAAKSLRLSMTAAAHQGRKARAAR